MRLEEIVDWCLSQVGEHVVLGLPLGLGKPNRLVNALYRRARENSAIRLEILTALSLNPPRSGRGLEGRMAGPFVERHFGADYPRLDYADDLEAGRLPANVTVTEFYFRSGAALGNAEAQRRYVSSNYTHVARDLLDRGVNLLFQLIARKVAEDGARYSLSSNPDVTLDLLELVRERPGHRCLLVGQVHPDLPFMEGDAAVPAAFFDRIVDADPEQRLFAIPRTPISIQDYFVGLNASALVADGGTLQIGIGSLGDALVHGLTLRQRHNGVYRDLLGGALPGRATIERIGGLAPLEQGLYGASEMFLDGFMHLYRAGILKREVFDDEGIQRLAIVGRLGERPGLAGTGALMDGAFFLGSQAFYDWLRALDDQERPRFRMSSVGRINQLYGGSEALETLQRQGARFFNSCMMVDLGGAAISDALRDHQVVSGVGGQYNFVAMAHAMEDGRSILMLRSTRESRGKTTSNLVWEYPHTTIPRHLRDVVVTEYGIADLRGRTDEECIQALLAIADARFQEELADTAVRAGKLAPSWRLPENSRKNLPETLEQTVAGPREAGHFPTFPFGSDFTAIEERLVPALQRLAALSHHRLGVLRALVAGGPDDPPALERLQLGTPRGARERIWARLVRWALTQQA